MTTHEKERQDDFQSSIFKGSKKPQDVDNMFFTVHINVYMFSFSEQVCWFWLHSLTIKKVVITLIFGNDLVRGSYSKILTSSSWSTEAGRETNLLQLEEHYGNSAYCLQLLQQLLVHGTFFTTPAISDKFTGILF